MQGTWKPVLPVHTMAERLMFQTLITQNKEFNPPNVSEPPWNQAVKVWNASVDESDEASGLYYKVISTSNNLPKITELRASVLILSLASNWRFTTCSGGSHPIQKKPLHVPQVSGNLWPMSSTTHRVRLLLHWSHFRPQHPMPSKRDSWISNKGHPTQLGFLKTPWAQNFTTQPTSLTVSLYPHFHHKDLDNPQPPPQVLKCPVRQQSRPMKLRPTKLSKGWHESMWQIPWQNANLRKKLENVAHA